MSDAEVLSPEKHGLILGGAAKVFAEHGYEGASMARIALEAGVSKGTLYNYFTGKAEMFAALIGHECTRRLADAFDTAEPEGDPARALQIIGERMLAMITSDIGLTVYRLVVAEAHKFPDLARTFLASGPERATRTMTAWLERQVQAGHLALDDPPLAAEQFFALCQTRIAMRRRLGMASDTDASLVVRGAVTMFLNTYGAKP